MTANTMTALVQPARSRDIAFSFRLLAPAPATRRSDSRLLTYHRGHNPGLHLSPSGGREY
jgi:hypothetical protein